jgi:hypothetical protein
VQVTAVVPAPTLVISVQTSAGPVAALATIPTVTISGDGNAQATPAVVHAMASVPHPAVRVPDILPPPERLDGSAKVAGYGGSISVREYGGTAAVRGPGGTAIARTYTGTARAETLAGTAR